MHLDIWYTHYKITKNRILIQFSRKPIKIPEATVINTYEPYFMCNQDQIKDCAERIKNKCK